MSTTTPAVPATPAPPTTPTSTETSPDVATLSRQLAETQAELVKLRKADEEARLTDRQRKEKHESELATRMAEVEKRAWLMDLRDAGIPAELAQFMGVPDPKDRAQALELAKKAYSSSLEAARKAAGTTTPAGPINPATGPIVPQPTPAAAADAKWGAIQKQVIDMGRKPR